MAKNKRLQIGHSGKVNENVNIYSLLEKSVKRRMVSDVPIGIQLSGGVDSSLLAAFIKKNKDSFESYGIVFENEKFNEEQDMLHVDRTLGINTRKILFKESDFLQLWKDTTYYFENPVNHEVTLGLLYLNRVASHYNRVLLCGEGADELFGGYSWYGKFSYYLKHPVISCILRIHRNGVVELKRDLNESFIRETQYIDDAQVMRIYHKADTKSIIKKRRSILKNIKDKGLRKYMKYDMLTYMQDILMRGDKASMAASVELRIPYIMPEVVEYVCGLDDDTFVKISKSVEMDNLKIPLKRIAENIYGKTFTYREKIGFGIDLHSFFFLQKNTRDYIEECLMPGIQRRGQFEYSVVKIIWDEEQEDNSTTKKTMMLWIILSFELWAQEYLD